MRESMVTRTVLGTKVKVLAMDTVSCEPSNVTYEIGGQHANDEKLLKRFVKNTIQRISRWLKSWLQSRSRKDTV